MRGRYLLLAGLAACTSTRPLSAPTDQPSSSLLADTTQLVKVVLIANDGQLKLAPPPPPAPPAPPAPVVPKPVVRPKKPAPVKKPGTLPKPRL